MAKGAAKLAQVTVKAAALTDRGHVRRQNQDMLGMDQERNLYVVCDGMGGAAGGEIASHLAADIFIHDLRETLRAEPHSEPKDALFHAATEANNRVLERALADPALHGMGSTLVGALVDGARLLLVNVGDSRAYLVRDGICTQLTVDHSYLNEQVARGLMTREMAERSSLQSVITRAVGIEHDVEPDLFGVDLEDGDHVLLASDGLIRHVVDAEIGEVVADTEVTLDERCARLIAMANDRGGVDNTSLILLGISFSS